MNLQALVRPGEPGRSPTRTRYCSKLIKGKECGLRTREGKLFCSEHVEEHDYVRNLMQRIENKEKEIEKVRKKGKSAITPDSENLKEIKSHLEINGSRTIRKLQRELQMTESTIEGFVDYLVDEEDYTRSVTSRGDAVINPDVAFA